VGPSEERDREVAPGAVLNAGRTSFGTSLPTRLEQARALIGAIQRLSLTGSVAEIQEIVRSEARRLTGADGATFILRDGSRCHYVDEDAISPLWKGQRFPMESCISGWTMLNRRAVAIEDIYLDPRIPHDAYRPTFVKSLAMVPIRRADPIGAIGNYWASRHLASAEEVELLQALADSTAVALENVRTYEELEQRVVDRTAELEARTSELVDTNRSIRNLLEEANRNYAALREREAHHLRVLHTLAHEVRTPLAAGRGILGLVLARERDEATLTDLGDVDSALAETIDVVERQLEEAKLEAGKLTVAVREVDVAGELAQLRAMFRAYAGARSVELVIEEPSERTRLRTDPIVLGHVLRNLLANALKFTDSGEVRVWAERRGEEVAFVVADTGIGIPEEDRERIFESWEQIDRSSLERANGFGLGLPLARRLVAALGGRIELESAVGVGSTFTVLFPPDSSLP
jgi:signal transduction histidine kinase